VATLLTVTCRSALDGAVCRVSIGTDNKLTTNVSRPTKTTIPFRTMGALSCNCRSLKLPTPPGAGVLRSASLWSVLSSKSNDQTACALASFTGPYSRLFGLEPVVKLRARLIAALDVEFVGAVADLFFEWKRFDRGFLCACGCWHGITSGDHGITDGVRSEGPRVPRITLDS
jgi:hypothetical protein